MGVGPGRSLRAVLAGSLVFGSVVVGGAVAASATTPTIVNCYADGNLQAAITAASPGATLIVHGTCTGNFTIGDNLTLQGWGALSGTGTGGSVLTITSGTVSVNNLTIENADTGGVGGGIDNFGTLTVTNSTLSDNTGGDGGGIFNSGTLTVNNSTVSGNAASYYGGGIWNNAALTLTNSTVSGNTAGFGGGGGIYNGSTLTVTNSTVSGNTASYYGGGIFNNGTVTQPSTDRNGVSINGNTSGGNGGGIDNEGGTVTLPNATVNRNGAMFGGGVYNDGGSTFRSSDTSVNHNTATSDGGGIYNNYGTVNLSTSVSVNSDTAVADGGGIYSTVVLSVPSGDVKDDIPDNLVE